MNKTKIQIIKGKDEFELVKNINNSQLDIFATNPIQKNDGSWVAFVYYKSAKMQEESHVLTSKKNNSTSAFIPSDKQKEQWSNEDVTESQKKILLKMGMTEKEISKASKLDAYWIIKNNKEERR